MAKFRLRADWCARWWAYFQNFRSASRPRTNLGVLARRRGCVPWLSCRAPGLLDLETLKRAIKQLIDRSAIVGLEMCVPKNAAKSAFAYDPNAATHCTSVAIGRRDALEELPRPAYLVRYGLYAPACPDLPVVGAVQKILAWISRRLTSGSLAAGGDLLKREEIPDLLRNFPPGTGIAIDFSEIGLTPRRSKKTKESFGEATNGMPVVVLQRKIRFASTKNPDSLQACPRVGSYR